MAPVADGATFESEWTMPRRGVDFSGMTVPTPDDAPWGADDVVATIVVTVDVGAGGPPLVSRTETPVGFDGRLRMVVEAAPRRGRDGAAAEPWLGLRGLVNLRVERRQWGSRGVPRVVAHGRCLARDAARMEALALDAVAADVRACAAACLETLASMGRGTTAEGDAR